MSLREWFWPSPRSRAVDMLASVAMRYRVLAANLKQHAEMCNYPTIRAGLEELAAAEEAQAKALEGFLSGNNHQAASGPMIQLDGANNWQRLKADLTLQSQMLSDLNQAIVLLEGRDHHAAVPARPRAEMRHAGARLSACRRSLLQMTFEAAPRQLIDHPANLL
jgi:hypothetical protein